MLKSKFQKSKSQNLHPIYLDDRLKTPGKWLWFQHNSSKRTLAALHTIWYICIHKPDKNVNERHARSETSPSEFFQSSKILLNQITQILYAKCFVRISIQYFKKDLYLKFHFSVREDHRWHSNSQQEYFRCTYLEESHPLSWNATTSEVEFSSF